MRKKRLLSLALASWMSLSLLSTTMGINVKAEENATEDATVVETASYTDSIEAETDETGESVEVDAVQEECTTEAVQLVEEEVEPQTAGNYVELNETNFPDPVFRESLEGYASNGKIDVSKVKELVIDYSVAGDLESIQGIQYFTEIETLEIKDGANIETLDLSYYPKLKTVDVSNNNIENIVGVGEKVETMYCSYNNLKNIDLSKAYSLTDLACNDNQLTVLDLKNNKKLISISLSKNKLQYLDLSKNTELLRVWVGENSLKNIDILNCNKIEILDLEKNELEKLDISKLLNVYEVVVSDNKLKELKLCSNSKLIRLYCYNNELTELDTTGIKNLCVVVCSNNKLRNLDFSTNTYLRYLICNHNELTSINVGACTGLTVLDCGYNKLNNIDVSNNSILSNIRCRYNNIKYLDLRNLDLDYGESQRNIILDTVSNDNINVYVGNDFNDKFSLITRDGEYDSFVFLYDTPNVYSNANIIKLEKNEVIPEEVIPPVTVTYNTHIQTYGWRAASVNGATSGTSGESKRLEAIKIDVSGADNLGVTYQTHVQSYGWQDWKNDGAISGTSGESKRLEAIRIKLTGANADKYDIFYRVHAQNYGWLGWAKNGASAGTAGQSLRLEAIQIVVLPKGETPTEACNAPSFIEIGKKASNADNAGMVNYMTHVQSYGDQSYVSDGSISGTSGESKRLEAIRIKLNNDLTGVSGGITYQTHIQKIGWQDWKSDGEMSGTSGKSYRLEAIRIKLTGEMEKKYDVYYRVHSQRYGWLGWAKNGEEAGTSGQSLRLEGIQIVLVPKGGAAPGSTSGSYIQK